MWTNIFLFLLTIGAIQHRSTSIPIDCATRVQICPIEKDDWVQKNDELKCATNYGYVCLRGWTGYLYESCIANFTIQAKIGNCPILYACFDNKPYLGAENTYYGCPKEVSGCPAKNHPEYSIHQLYKYPKCLESNFPDEKENTSQRLTEFNSTTTISTGHITVQKNRHVTIVILTLLFTFVGCFTFYIVYARKKCHDIVYARKKCHDIVYARKKCHDIVYARKKCHEDDKSKDLLRSVLQSLNESDPEEDQILPLKGDDKRKEDRIHVPEEVGIVKKIRSTKPTDRQTLSNIKPDKTLNLRPGKEPRDAGYRKTVQTISKYWKAETSKEVNDNKVIKTKNTKNRSKRKIKRQQAKRL